MYTAITLNLPEFILEKRELNQTALSIEFK